MDVESAQEPPVLLGRGTARRPGLDVVTLAVLGRLVAVGMRAHPVPQLDGAARASREESGPDTDVDAVPELEYRPLEVGRVASEGIEG